MYRKLITGLGVVLVGLVVSLVLTWMLSLALLDVSETQLNQDLGRLRNQPATGTAKEACVEDDVLGMSGSATRQLRFVSPQEYIFEVVCFSRPLEGVELDRRHLPPFVVRSGGAIGMIVNQQSDPIQLQVFPHLTQFMPQWLGSKLRWLSGYTTVVFQDGHLVGQNNSNILPVWTGGVRSACSAFGYMCCDIKNQVGNGQVLSDTLDCPGRCYAKCDDRPLVLSFGADGGFDPTTRSVAVQSQTEVNFSYVGQAGSYPIKSAVISFGDGQKVSLTPDTATASHQYSCSQVQCNFDASITLIDTQNHTSPISAVTVLQVRVSH